MKIADGVAMLPLTAEVLGQPATVYPALLWDDTNTILVDAGYPGQLPLIRAAMAQAGVPFARLTKIIITHHDVDHIGSLKSILAASPRRPMVIAHTAEKPYIQGDKQPLKVAKLAAGLAALPPAMKAVYDKLAAFYQTGTVAVTATVADGEQLPGGIEVIHTPGHTRGHICLYLRPHKILIAGDAMWAEGGRLALTPATATDDIALYMQSLEKLAAYDIATAICYHGGLCQDNINRQIAALAQPAGVGR